MTITGAGSGGADTLFGSVGQAKGGGDDLFPPLPSLAPAPPTNHTQTQVLHTHLGSMYIKPSKILAPHPFLFLCINLFMKVSYIDVQYWGPIKKARDLRDYLSMSLFSFPSYCPSSI